MRELIDGRKLATLTAISVLTAILVSACSRHENNLVGAAYITNDADKRTVRDSLLTPPDTTADFQLAEPAEGIGTSATLLVGQRPTLGYLARGLLKFDSGLLPDSGIVILEASVDLKYRGGRRDTDPPFTMTLHRVTSDWDEDVTSPDSFPAFGAALDTLDLGSPAEEDTVSILLTSLMQHWVDHADSNFGLALVPGAGAGSMLEFDSSEAVLSEPPRLTYRFVSTSGDTTESLPRLPLADTFVLEETGSFVPAPGQPGLLTVGRGFPSRTLLQFTEMDSLPDFGTRATVNRAQLTLSIDAASSDFTTSETRKMLVEVRRVTSDEWQDADTETSTKFTSQSIEVDDAEVVFEVTELVEGMRQEGDHGFLVRIVNERRNVDLIRFHGADASMPDLRPTLRVWWTPGGVIE